MNPAISRGYHAHSGNYPAGATNWRRYIAIHNTGNTASALNEARYAANNSHGSSFHYVLDGGGVIYQTLNDNERSWSVGGWSGTVQYISNAEVISIEVVSNGDRFTAAEVSELAYLVPLLMERHGIDAAHVVRHYDCHSGRKRCPAAYCGTAANDAAWEELKATITGGNDVQLSDKLNDTPLPDGSNNNVCNALNAACQNSFEILDRVDEIAQDGIPVSLDLDTLADKVAARLGDQLAHGVADILAARLKD